VSEVEPLAPLPLPDRNEAAGETVRDAPVPVLVKEAIPESGAIAPLCAPLPKSAGLTAWRANRRAHPQLQTISRAFLCLERCSHWCN